MDQVKCAAPTFATLPFLAGQHGKVSQLAAAASQSGQEKAIPVSQMSHACAAIVLLLSTKSSLLF